MKHAARYAGLMGLATLIGLVIWASALAGTTGKIAGIVTDAANGRPLPGVNVLLEETTLGASTDLNGRYFILNVPAGVYALRAEMIGYSPMRQTEVQVNVDLTATVDFSLQETVLDVAEVITVVAERPLVRMDVTSSSQITTAREIQEMPVEEVDDIIETQAAVTTDIDGHTHMRGGRKEEVAYMVDGILVKNPYSGQMDNLNINASAIEEMVAVSGTFNAEYGNAMSGIVNIVTKAGGQKPSGRFSAYVGDHVSDHTDVFPDIDDIEPFNVRNLQGSIGGPLPLLGHRTAFFLSGQVDVTDGYLYGYNKYSQKALRDENENILPDTTRPDFMERVSMKPDLRMSFSGKLTFQPVDNIKLTAGYLRYRREYKTYDHRWKYLPESTYNRRRQSDRGHCTLTHTLNLSTFYSLRLSYMEQQYRYFLWGANDPDSGYADPRYDRVEARDYQSQNFWKNSILSWWFKQKTISRTYNFDLTSQIHQAHQVKTGFEFNDHELTLFEIDPTYNAYVSGDSRFAFNRYRHRPYELAGYIQDKIELRDMIINAGIRFDHFQPDGWKFAVGRDESEDFPEEDSVATLETSSQLSPRLGVAHPISDKGVLYFSYGHFFQIPSYNYIYTNSELELRDKETAPGELKPQKTVIYEVGFKQEMVEDLALNVTGFYKDITNLIATKRFKLTAAESYFQYVNRDYGNVKGVTVELTRRQRDLLGFDINYTYQVAEGNASDPDAEHDDWAANLRRQPEKKVVPLDWDQTHTLNISVTLGQPDNWGLGLIGKYGSGLPYTPLDVKGHRTGEENSERKPAQLNFDLNARKDFIWRDVYGRDLRTAIFIRVYNLFDRKNEIIVWDSTGRSTYNLNPYENLVVEGGEELRRDYINRPHFYSEPRKVLVGFEVEF
jgi:outer membrane receptor protein involved in Fe transport